MSSFVHRDLIAEKLEIARTLGLVARYVVRPTDDGTGLSVRVWRSPAASEQAVRHYLTRLLDSLVSDNDVVVVSDGEVPVRAEPADGTVITSVPAAA
jgi:hypothetical protein